MQEDDRSARFDLVLFGGTGDLALRKLMPALYYGVRDGVLAGANIVGAARQPLSTDDYRALLTREVPRHLADDHDPAHFVPALPLMDDARKLAHLDPNSNAYKFLLTRLVRSRNKVLHYLETATASLKAIAAA